MRFPKILGQSTPTQLVEEAVPTLCNRLSHASLASDRRSAILGLKSFSRQYRETVAEYGLRPLVSALIKEHASADTVKSILETLLILFIRGESEHADHTRGWISHQSRVQNGKYPSPLLIDDVSLDQFSLWIADELSQNTETMSTLIEILSEHDDFYIKLYSLQILESMVSTRATRTKDIILSIPTAISILVSLLKDPQEPVRNEAILLLMALVNNNFQIQKLVAFENTFDTLFDVIDEEGGIRGSIIVQDCLSLISNLLLYNASNQNFFLETQCVPRLAKLIGEPVEEVMDDDSGEALDFVWNEQRIQNTIIALDICSSFAAQDNELKASNQNSLYKAGVHLTILRLVFSIDSDKTVRSSALWVIADLISGNCQIQDEFSRIDVPYIDPTSPSHTQTYANLPVYMCLLNWCLYINSVHFFDLRLAAAHCLHAYFQENHEKKANFLSDQITSFSQLHGSPGSEGNDESPEPARADNRTPNANVLSTLMDYSDDIAINPYSTWFASIVLLYVFEDSDDLKEVVRMVKTGDESAGEEVMSSIPAISGLLLTSLELANHRAAIGYLMLLTTWLFADFAAVSDFLSDTSVTNSLLAYLANNATNLSSLLHGMITILLGVVYEFSTKSSAIPRAELHALLKKALGQENYTLKVKQFKDSTSFKSFDEDSRLTSTKDETGLPDVYFDAIYVTLIKENFARIKKSLFHDPQRDPHGHVTYEMFEEIDTRLASAQTDLEQAAKESQEIEKRLLSEIEAYRKSHSELEELATSANNESTKAKEKLAEVMESYDSTKSELEKCQKEKNELQTLSSKYYKELKDLSKSSQVTNGTASTIKSKLESAEAAKKKLEDGINKMTREMMQMSKEIVELQAQIKKLQKTIDSNQAEKLEIKRVYEAQLSNIRSDLERTKTNLAALTSKYESVHQQHATEKSDLMQKLHEAEDNAAHLMDKLRAAASAYQDLKRRSESQKRSPETADASLDMAQKETINDELRLAKAKAEKLQKEVELLISENTRIKDELLKTSTISANPNDFKEAERTVVEGKIVELQANNVSLALELENIRSDAIAQLDEAVLHKQSQVEDLELRLSQALAKAEELEERAQTNETSLEISKNTEIELKGELDAKSEIIADLTKLLDSQNVERTDALAESITTANYDKLNAELAAAHSRVEELELEIKKLKAEQAQLNSQRSADAARCKELEADNVELKLRVERYKSENTECANATSGMQNKLDEEIRQRELAFEQVQRVKEECNRSKETQVKLQQQIDQSRTTLERLESEVLSLQEASKAKDLANKKLEDDIEALKLTNSSLIKELSQESTMRADLECQLADSQHEVENLQSQLNSDNTEDSRHLEQTLAHYEDTNENLRSLLEMLKAEVERSHKKIASMQKDGAGEYRPLSSTQDENTSLVESLQEQLNTALLQQEISQEAVLGYELREKQYKEEIAKLRGAIAAKLEDQNSKLDGNQSIETDPKPLLK